MDDLKRLYKLAAIIGLAMIASVFIYAGVVEYFKKTQESFAGIAKSENLEFLRYVFFGIAAAQYFLIKFIRNIFLSAKTSSQSSAPKLLTTSIITYALCESVAVYGFVLFFIAGNSMDFYIFMLISLFYFSSFFPKYSQWEEWVKEQNKKVL